MTLLEFFLLVETPSRHPRIISAKFQLCRLKGLSCCSTIFGIILQHFECLLEANRVSFKFIKSFTSSNSLIQIEQECQITSILPLHFVPIL